MSGPRPFSRRRASAFSRKKTGVQERSRAAVPIFTIPTETCSKSSIWLVVRLPRARRRGHPRAVRLNSRPEVEHLPEALQLAQLCAAARIRATDIIENLAVLEPVIAQPLHPPLFVG